MPAVIVLDAGMNKRAPIGPNVSPTRDFMFLVLAMGHTDTERYFLPTSQDRRRILLLTPLVERPLIASGITAAAAIHLTLANAGGHGMGCIFRDLTGLPCPGCGLTQACLALIHGEWRSGFV